jgi:hypothetical protein
MRGAEAPELGRSSAPRMANFYPKPTFSLTIKLYCRPSSVALVALALLGIGALADTANAQTCTVSGSSGSRWVADAAGTPCAIPPNTTLNGNVPATPGNPVIYATGAGSEITTNNVTVSPFNGGSTGGLATANGVIIFSAGSSINGNWSTAASAQTGGTIIFQPGSVINPAYGGGGTALLANGAGSQIIASGLSANLNGAGGNIGANATNGAVISLNGGTTITYAPGGGGNTGLWATGAGSQIVTNGVTVSMPGGGGNDTAVRADAGTSVTLANSTISVLGNGGNETGLFANGGSITGSDTTITVSSPGGPARGGVLQNGATIALTGGSVTTSGTPGSYGFLFLAGTNALSLNGTTVSAASDAFAVQAGTATINTEGATVTGNPYSGNNGILLSVTNSSTATMTSNSSTLTGAITTAAGSTSNVTLGGGTTWNMTASSNATNLTNNDSNILVTAPVGDPTSLAAYKTLTVMNYTGTGGKILLNTYLGTDGSPSDQLIVNGGTATGTTSLAIHNTTGPGAETLGNGILVVNAINGGTTAPGAFMLNGEVRAGAFDYDLFRGGVGGSSPNDWFLRSDFIVPEPPGVTPPGVLPPIVLPPPATPPDAFPADPPPSILPPGIYPIIGPEIATYGVVQPIARQLGLATLGTLNQRIGDTMTLANAGTSGTGWASSAWGRFFGQQINNQYRAFAESSASGGLGGFQAGLDLWRGDTFPGHRDAAGVYFALSQATMSVDGLVTNPAATGYIMTAPAR